MKQGSIKKDFIGQNVKSIFVFLACLILSACSATSLKSFDASEITATNKISVFLATECNEVTFGEGKLLDAKSQLKQAITNYGFSVVEANQADFMLYFECRKESDLNFGIIANGISAMLMVASITVIPTYWPSDLWVGMEVYDLRTVEAEKLEAFESSYVSQERIVWAPFILFKFANDFGLPKYNFNKVYNGLRSSALSLLNEADSKSIFE
ncbi:MAG: hypothetical protein ACI8O8_002055 [Oleiphilaceae bacterium]|jgi:hypothetical protein